MSARHCNELRLTGSAGANRVMEAEVKRLVMRSPFPVRVEKPKREGEATLLLRLLRKRFGELPE